MAQGTTFYYEWEVMFMQWLQNVLGSTTTMPATVISYLGEEVVLIAVWGIMYWCIDKKCGRFLGLSICLGIVINPMIKNLVLRRRPYCDHPEIRCYKPVDPGADIYDLSAQGFSFPSMHSANSVLIYGGLASYMKKKPLTVIGIVIPLLVGLSRIAVGVHYPTDVIAGLVLGILFLALATFLHKRAQRRWLLYIVIFVLSCLGVIFCRSNDYYTALGFMGGFFAGDIFEEKFVRFKNTKSPLKCVLRTVIGFAVFLGLNSVLKLPFSKEFLNSATMAAYMVRMVRYLIVNFVIVGVYPYFFGKIKALSSDEEAGS